MSRSGVSPSPETITEAFGATVEVTRSADDAGFFLVTPAATHREPANRPAFEQTLLSAVGGREAVFLAEGNTYLVYTTFAAAETLRRRPETGTVGGVAVDADRLRETLGV